ncbi:MAG: PhoH family protein, partial [Verrucomicrobiae bacterium]|nr:PhoH family protein [Verrucomicrobiae bacterium]
LQQLLNGRIAELHQLVDEPLVLKFPKKKLIPKTLNQKRYLEAIFAKEIVFGIGPAGTGKTYLAMAAAIHALLQGEIEKIILTRPAVEAGEALGFLPGDLEEKITPYLRPLYDAIHDMLGKENGDKLMEKGVIEIAPLAYMRGRTLSKAFIILDEAQNTSSEQMMMFLTRLGDNSRMIVTGDITQIDLPRNKESGLRGITHILNHIPEIELFYFESFDVVRHPLVQKIIEAYEHFRSEGHPRG